jgi:hypothetical protein
LDKIIGGKTGGHKMSSKDMPASLAQISAAVIENNIRLCIEFLEELGPSSIQQVSGRAGMKSKQWAGKYLNEAVRRRLVVVTKKSRPKTFALPSQTNIKPRPQLEMFERKGRNDRLVVYVDESIINKLDALAAHRCGLTDGGRSVVITNLVSDEFAKVNTKSDLSAIVIEMNRHKETMDRLRGKTDGK